LSFTNVFGTRDRDHFCDIETRGMKPNVMQFGKMKLRELLRAHKELAGKLAELEKRMSWLPPHHGSKQGNLFWLPIRIVYLPLSSTPAFAGRRTGAVPLRGHGPRLLLEQVAP